MRVRFAEAIDIPNTALGGEDGRAPNLGPRGQGRVHFGEEVDIPRPGLEERRVQNFELRGEARVRFGDAIDIPGPGRDVQPPGALLLPPQVPQPRQPRDFDVN